MWVTGAPVRLVNDEKLPPVALQLTPALSFVVAVTCGACVLVRPARFGLTLTVIGKIVNATPLLA